ncbi:MAG: filamentous hemagglutinin N-terminal domain-containing protein, partial [Verrucomicrobiaceae bacterium]|nr:filamentous hemagglutinin N-terminal domain-containing protein [Verrucomicrobiaceae bacterium]
MTSSPPSRRSENPLFERENPTRSSRKQTGSLAARRFIFLLFRWRGWIALPLLVSLCFPFSLYANPSGGLVTAGQATISSHGSTLTVNQLTDRAILHWQDFSIAAGETTTFIQPSAGSAALNRVFGSNPSAIHGTLSSNGQIFLINPNGILVGPTGVVDTGGFLASTLDISDENFLSGGDLRFKGNSDASVVNLGKISASSSDVILIARTVENHGEIHAPNGTAALAAGSEVLVKASGEERIFVEAGNAEGASKATQAGLIAAATA